MISIYMIFITLATTALAKGSIECSLSETAGAQMCFGAVGQLLTFHLPNTVNTHMGLIKDNKYIILKIVKNQIVTLNKEYVNQPEVFNDGKIKLGNAMKKHTGDYVLEQFGSNGVLLKKLNVHLVIQAPVSKPAVSQTCLSPEQMNISCSSEGDGVEFILTLDNLLLMRTRSHSQSQSDSTANMESLADSTAKQNKSSNSNVTISLHGQETGNLMCRVSNNISRDETVLRLTDCTASISHSTVVLAVRTSIVTLLLLALCLGICHVHKKTSPKTVNEGSGRHTFFCIVKMTAKQLRFVKGPSVQQ